MKPSLIIRMALVGVGVAALSACGGSPSSIFKNATFSTFTQNGDQYLQLETDISSKNVIFTGVTIPIESHSQIIGDVQVATNITTGTSSMIVQLDLSKVLHLPTPTFNGNLPNGLPWPVTGIDLTKMMAFSVGSDGSTAYLYYDPVAKQAFVGAALAVNALSTGVPVTLFSTFSTSGITGVVGLYTGKNKGQSGVAFLANVSSKLPVFPTSLHLAVRAQVRRPNTHAVQFYSTSPRAKVRRQIDWELYRMNKSHTRITLQ